MSASASTALAPAPAPAGETLSGSCDVEVDGAACPATTLGEALGVGAVSAEMRFLVDLPCYVDPGGRLLVVVTENDRIVTVALCVYQPFDPPETDTVAFSHACTTNAPGECTVRVRFSGAGDTWIEQCGTLPIAVPVSPARRASPFVVLGRGKWTYCNWLAVDDVDTVLRTAGVVVLGSATARATGTAGAGGLAPVRPPRVHLVFDTTRCVRYTLSLRRGPRGLVLTGTHAPEDEDGNPIVAPRYALTLGPDTGPLRLVDALNRDPNFLATCRINGRPPAPALVEALASESLPYTGDVARLTTTYDKGVWVFDARDGASLGPLPPPGPPPGQEAGGEEKKQ